MRKIFTKIETHKNNITIWRQCKDSGIPKKQIENYAQNIGKQI
jgi:hypothetical protein